MIKIKLHKKKPEKSIGALVVILDQNNKTLILLRPSNVRWSPNTWGYPGGKIEDGETPRETAIRETKEETQLDVYNIKKIGIEANFPCVPYYTREYSGEIEIDYEHDDWKWVSDDEIENYPLAPGTLDMFKWVLKNG